MLDKINSIMVNNLDKVKSCSATIEPLHIKTRDDLLKEIADFKHDEGWLCLTDKVLVMESGHVFDSSDKAEVLSGEFVSGDRSMHIRQGTDGWDVYTITSSNGGTQLMVNEEFLAIPDKDITKLKYETFWAENEGVYKLYVSRFTGFEKGGK